MIQTQSTMYKIIAFVCLLALSVQFTACERNRCITRGIACQNNGVCNDGNCLCPEGFEGDSCQFATNKKFVGRFEGIFTIADSNQVFSDTITVAQNAGNNLGINWTHDMIKNAVLKGNIRTTDILIPTFKAANGHTYSGSGSLNKDIFTLKLRDDTLVGGNPYKTYNILFAGNRIK
jgi:hypothetical protein